MRQCEQAPLWKKQMHENHSHMNLWSFLCICRGFFFFFFYLVRRNIRFWVAMGPAHLPVRLKCANATFQVGASSYTRLNYCFHMDRLTLQQRGSLEQSLNKRGAKWERIKKKKQLKNQSIWTKETILLVLNVRPLCKQHLCVYYGLILV